MMVLFLSMRSLLQVAFICVLYVGLQQSTAAFEAPHTRMPKNPMRGSWERPAAVQQRLGAAASCPDLVFVSSKPQKRPLLSLLLACALTTAALPAQAAARAFDPLVYTNDYADPLHPFCKRHIEVASDGITFHYSGTGVGKKDDTVLRGCTPSEIKEFGLRQGAFDGSIDGAKIWAGDGIHEGVWEPAGEAKTSLRFEDVDGIRWNDGNKWTVQARKDVSLAEQGFRFFLAYIGFSTLAGLKEIVKRFSGDSSKDAL